MSQAPSAHRLDWLARLQSMAPLLLAAALAGFSWWLVSSSPERTEPRRPEPDRGVPDYELASARLARFDAKGRLESVLDGERMRHFPASQTLEIDRMQVASRHPDGRRMQAEALRGEWNEGSGVATLTGGADVRLSPALPGAPGSAAWTSLTLSPRAPSGASRDGVTRLVGEQLRLDTRSRVVSSTQPVVLTRDGSEVRAQSLEHNDATGLTLLGGRVNGHLAGRITGQAR
ncbi:MAG: LPS export ABC transporter periplasmic protein LptC [Burkholderiales bacterium]|nr:LPS export ABC transporter periplasmic protein LptC [Burkholderiales bacterium]